MRKVVALGVLKRQLNVVELRIGGNVHRQTRPGKVAGVIETHVMLNHRRVGPFGQFKMVAIVGGVDFIALYALGDMHQQQRFFRALVTPHADMRHRLRQAFGKVQEDLRLHRCRQASLVVSALIATPLLTTTSVMLVTVALAVLGYRMQAAAQRVQANRAQVETSHA